MTFGLAGWWGYRLRLAPGSYQFKHLADGHWYVDSTAFGVEQGPFGWSAVVLWWITMNNRQIMPTITEQQEPV
jgi:hypothetical protein